MQLRQNEQGRKKKSRREAYDLADLRETQFDVIDKFDMFENPHDDEEPDSQQLRSLYGVSITIALNFTNFCYCRVKNIRAARLSSTRATTPTTISAT